MSRIPTHERSTQESWKERKHADKYEGRKSNHKEDARQTEEREAKKRKKELELEERVAEAAAIAAAEEDMEEAVGEIMMKLWKGRGRMSKRS